MNPATFIQFTGSRTSVETPRLRKAHHKSRLGCSNCKARRVKCDERRPKCSACQKTGEQCVRNQSRHRTVVKEYNTPVRIHPTQGPKATHNLEWNLLEQFHCTTIDTLALGGSLWKDMIPLAVKESHLMHAMVSIAAAHLQIEQDDASTLLIRQIGLEAQISAIQQVSKVVIEDKQGSDAVIATLILLCHHSWAVSDENETFASYNGSALLRFSSALPQASWALRGMLSTVVLNTPSMWLEVCAFSPKVALLMFVASTNIIAELKAFFERQFWQLWPDDTMDRFELFSVQCERLLPVLGALLVAERESLDLINVSASVDRFLFTWPLLCTEQFCQMLDREDFLAEVVLFHFYSAVDRYSFHPIWWSRRRTHFGLRRAKAKFEEAGFCVASVFESLGPLSSPYAVQVRNEVDR